MTLWGWLAVGLAIAAGWLAFAAVVGGLLGRVIRSRDLQAAREEQQRQL